MKKKGDLVRFEYLAQHHSGVGWKRHKGVGIIVDYNLENDSYRIMTDDGAIVERLDMQIDVISHLGKTGNECMMVYIAIRGDHKNLSEILGAYSNEESAVARCMKQPTYTRQAWIRDDSTDSWHNGHGMYVKVVKYELN